MHDLGSQDLASRETASLARRPDEARRASDDDPAALRDVAWPEGARARLGRMIEAEIVPRLLLAHHSEAHPRASIGEKVSGLDAEPPDVEEFAERLIGEDEDPALEFVAALERQGRPSLEILIDLLAPAARRLGALWETDDCDFIDVTIGLRRLTQILRRLSPDENDAGPPFSRAPRILLLATPGESHIFGIAMAEAFFRADGWRVTRGGGDYTSVLASSSFDIVGFSLSTARHLEALATAVRTARSTSRNSEIRVLVGGPIFAGGGLAERVGADAAASDARSAIHLARRLLRRPHGLSS
jgi:methanogenic corrinoid protein MtbC1